MDYFGINSPDDLPKIKEVLAEQLIQPTAVNHTEFEAGESLVVSGEGELLDAILETEQEDQINGHSFEPGSLEAELEHLSGDDNFEKTEEPTEDLATEEVAEEFIADEVFIEGDEEEIEEEVEEEILPEEDPEENKDSEEEDDSEGTSDPKL
jgi:segregation and condensation protein B